MRILISVSRTLTSKERKVIDTALYGLPELRKYPMPDRKHAINAKARAKQQLDLGKLSQADYDRIIAKADRVLGKK